MVSFHDQRTRIQGGLLHKERLSLLHGTRNSQARTIRISAPSYLAAFDEWAAVVNLGFLRRSMTLLSTTDSVKEKLPARSKVFAQPHCCWGPRGKGMTARPHNCRRKDAHMLALHLLSKHMLSLAPFDTAAQNFGHRHVAFTKQHSTPTRVGLGERPETATPGKTCRIMLNPWSLFQHRTTPCGTAAQSLGQGHVAFMKEHQALIPSWNQAPCPCTIIV